jgi:flavin reductase (DIM6/NTAB) family NADH-FMN oxidoreductase RutF
MEVDIMDILPYVKNGAFLTAKHNGKVNTMTISWGNIGIEWGEDVFITLVRDSRFTKGFIDNTGEFTVTIPVDDSMKKELSFCGTKSGRDCDKAALTGLKPCFVDGAVTFEQARLVFVCRKIYVQDISPEGFVDKSIENHYPIKDYHRLYCGEIVSVLERR